MSERHIGYIPVKQERHLVGVITIGDVLKNRLYDRREATRAVYILGVKFPLEGQVTKASTERMGCRTGCASTADC